MARNPDSPELIFSEGLTLPDGRKVRVLSYSDSSVRFRLEGAPYVLTEAFLPGGSNKLAILKLSPGKRGDRASGDWHDEDGSD